MVPIWSFHVRLRDVILFFFLDEVINYRVRGYQLIYLKSMICLENNDYFILNLDLDLILLGLFQTKKV